MAFALSGMRTYGVETYEAGTSRFLQYVEFDITGAAADVALDIGDSAGTFWTAAADATSNAVFQDILTKVQACVSFFCPQLLAKILAENANAPATGEYTVTSPQNTNFEITIFGGQGLTAYTIALCYGLKDDIQPVTYKKA